MSKKTKPEMKLYGVSCLPFFWADSSDEHDAANAIYEAINGDLAYSVPFDISRLDTPESINRRAVEGMHRKLDLKNYIPYGECDEYPVESKSVLEVIEFFKTLPEEKPVDPCHNKVVEIDGKKYKLSLIED